MSDTRSPQSDSISKNTAYVAVTHSRNSIPTTRAVLPTTSIVDWIRKTVQCHLTSVAKIVALCVVYNFNVCQKGEGGYRT